MCACKDPAVCDEPEGAVKCDVWYQMRCIYCKREQYMLAVAEISHGVHPCVWCGMIPPVFTVDTREEYREALRLGDLPTVLDRWPPLSPGPQSPTPEDQPAAVDP